MLQGGFNYCFFDIYLQSGFIQSLALAVCYRGRDYDGEFSDFTLKSE